MYGFDIKKNENFSENIEHYIYHMPDGVKVSYQMSQPDCSPHSHEYIEIFYILEGSIEHGLNGNNLILHEGDFALIDHNSYHQFKKIENENCSLVNVIFYPGFIDKSLSEKDSFKDILCSHELQYGKNLPSDDDINRIYHDTNNAIRNLILSIQQEFFSANFGRMKILKAHLTSLIILVLRHMLKPQTLTKPETSIDYTIEYINRNYNQKISLTELSEMLHYTPQHFCSKFKKATGFSFTEYLQKVRIEQSCKLLQNTNMKITEIANAVGYSDIQYFEKIFIKHITRTPSKFRKFLKDHKSGLK